MARRTPHSLARWRALGALLLICVLASPLRSQTSNETVTVDFAAPREVSSASGLLFGATPTTAASELAPIRPRLFRFHDYYAPSGSHYSWSGLADRVRAIAPNVELNLLLGPGTELPHRTPPHQNWPAYEAYLTELVDRLADAGVDGVWEVWNEPDFPDFWSGTREQFFELYLRAYRILRQRLGPDADVAGPSFGVYTHAAVEAFLEYCLANACEVNTLTFHANDDTPNGVSAFPLNVNDARASFLNNPRYAPLRIRRIVNNEIGGPIYTRQPAGTLAHYAAFEAGGGSAAARSCWNDSQNRSDCFNGTLDGLLTSGSLQRRSAWWAQKYYADGVATRVASTTSGANVVALASRGSESAIPQVLVGHVDFFKTLNRQPGSLSARLVMHNIRAIPEFSGAGRVTVRVESIPDTGEASLVGPSLKSELVADLVAGNAQIILPPIAVGEVLRVTLLPRSDGVPDRPQSFRAAVGDNTVSLQWMAPPLGPAATGYVLEVGATPNSFAIATLPLSNVTSFNASAPTGVYYVRVRGTNASGQSEPTQTIRLDVGCTAPPGTPRDLEADVNGSSVLLLWQESSGNVARYVLEAGSASGLRDIVTVPLPPNPRTLSATAPPGTYYLRVRAANACGTSGPSSEVFIVVGSSTTLPGKPLNVAWSVAGSSVSFSWTPPLSGGAPTAYVLEAGSAPGLSNLARVVLGTATTFATGPGVPPGTYYVRVRAVNAAGIGSVSDEVRVVVP